MRLHHIATSPALLPTHAYSSSAQARLITRRLVCGSPVLEPAADGWMDSIDVIKHPVVDHVKLQCNGEVLEGTLCISAFHLIFSTRRQNVKDITVRID